MNRFLLTSALFGELESVMVASPLETCALLWGSFGDGSEENVRFVAREMERVPEAAYTIRSEIRAQLTAEYVGHACNEARRRRESVVFLHSHPDFEPVYSPIDDAGEKELAALFALRTPGLRHATFIYSKVGCTSRVLGAGTELEVFVVGNNLSSQKPEIRCDTERNLSSGEEELLVRYDRQARAFGAAGQAKLRRVDIGVVGVGGTGSVLASQLAYLGVRSLTLIDADLVESANLNRLLGANASSVGRPKVGVVDNFLSDLLPELKIKKIEEKFPSRETLDALLGCDVVFCCTDSEGSRHVLNELAYQYLLPVVDLGTEIDARRTPMVLQVRSQLLSFGLPCHTCTNFLDGNRVRWDLQPDSVRHADPYFRGGGEPAPSVISLNSAAVSFAVNILISLVTGSPSPRAVKGDMATGLFRAFTADIEPNCVTCSGTRGRLARGSTLPITGVPL